jgi:hypothetical protein
MIGKLLETKDYAYGLDIGEYADLIKKGIIDPTKVVGCPHMTIPSRAESERTESILDSRIG